MADDDCLIISEERLCDVKNQQTPTSQSSAKRLKQAWLPFKVKESPAAGQLCRPDETKQPSPKEERSNDAVITSSPVKYSSSSTPAIKKRRIELVSHPSNSVLKTKEKKESLKAEAKERRERERNELKLKKEIERQEKENEREEKKKQKLAEKQKKQELLELEKRKKEELKIEEKRKKEEEKKKKEEEKLHESEKVSQKEKQLMQKFFFKSSKEKPTVKCLNTGETARRFMDFEVKPDMRLAPIRRIDATKEQLVDIARNLSDALEKQACTSLYLDELKQESYKPRVSKRTWPCNEVSVVIVESENVSVEAQSSKFLMKAKLFQFHENYRPAYYGTWRKRSNVISGRRPIRKDESQLDYEVDSDDEWEEEEPGESISHSEGENEEDQVDDDDDDDGFFVPHGYLSEDEVCEDENEKMSPSKLKEYQQAKAKFWEAEMNSKRCEILKPVCVTVMWWESSETNNPLVETLNKFKMVLLEPTPIQLMKNEEFSVDNTTNVVEIRNNVDGSAKKHKGKNWMPVPSEALPDLMRLVHGNQHSIQKLTQEFREYWLKQSHTQGSDCQMTDAVTESRITDSTDDTTSKYTISKRQLEAKIREIAVYELRPQLCNKKLWYVKDEVLYKLGLLGLPVPTQWKWSSKILDEKLKL